MRRADLVSGVVVALAGVVALALALEMALFGAGGVPGPGFFPTLLSSVLIVLGLVLGVLSLRPAGPAVRAVGQAEPEVGADQEHGGSWHSLRRPALVWVLFVASVPVLSVLGFVPTMVLLMAALMFGVERRRGPRPLFGVIVIPVALYVLFVDLLSIQLPTGLIYLGPLGS